MGIGRKLITYVRDNLGYKYNLYSTVINMTNRELRMGPYAEFGIIDDYNENENYEKYEPEKYNCVPIPDDVINDWWESLLSMNVRPFGYETVHTVALNRWGVTIIPPESLSFFIEIIKSKTSLRYESNKRNKELARMLNTLIDVIQKANNENKHMIHYGV